jgi:formamidopyrimidine-DNA glycosylase
MPELPEVETIVVGLRELITGHIIKDVLIREEKVIAFPPKEEFESSIKGKEIQSVNRRGKYILINLSEGMTMVVHLRMTGRLMVLPKEVDYDKHTHVVFHLENGLDLRFHNLRKFGRIYLVQDNQFERVGNLTALGPEPLSVDFTLEKFKELLQGRTTNIKALLLKQDFIAGLGNIYTDEALFEAGISPRKLVKDLTDEQIDKLYKAIKAVLQRGIKYGGTSFSDYRNARNEKGDFQNRLSVYKQKGKKCPRCGAEIVKEKIAGRGTHYCPQCQH